MQSFKMADTFKLLCKAYFIDIYNKNYSYLTFFKVKDILFLILHI